MLKKIEDAFAVALVALLSVTALVIKIMQDNLHLQVMDADSIVVNIAFVLPVWPALSLGAKTAPCALPTLPKNFRKRQERL